MYELNPQLKKSFKMVPEDNYVAASTNLFYKSFASFN